MTDFIDISSVLGSGVYALVVRGEVVYIGRAKRLLARIYAHRNNYRRYRNGTEVIIPIKAIYFTHVWVLPCRESDLDRLEREMIAKFLPKENQLLLPKEKRTLEGSGFNFIVMGMDLRKRNEPDVIERRF